MKWWQRSHQYLSLPHNLSLEAYWDIDQLRDTGAHLCSSSASCCSAVVVTGTLMSRKVSSLLLFSSHSRQHIWLVRVPSNSSVTQLTWGEVIGLTSTVLLSSSLLSTTTLFFKSIFFDFTCETALKNDVILLVSCRQPRLALLLSVGVVGEVNERFFAWLGMIMLRSLVVKEHGLGSDVCWCWFESEFCRYWEELVFIWHWLEAWSSWMREEEGCSSCSVPSRQRRNSWASCCSFFTNRGKIVLQ